MPKFHVEDTHSLDADGVPGMLVLASTVFKLALAFATRLGNIRLNFKPTFRPWLDELFLQ